MSATGEDGALRSALAARFADEVARQQRPAITIEKGDGGMWHARSTDPSQGEIGGSLEVVLPTVAAWMRGENG